MKREAFPLGGTVLQRENDQGLGRNAHFASEGPEVANRLLIQADGNLLWGLKDGPKQVDFFAKFRQSALFTASKKQYASGWGAHDLFADPKFVRLETEGGAPLDVRLQSASPAVDAGVELPAGWFDPLRKHDQGTPDIGALPLGVEIFPAGRR